MKKHEKDKLVKEIVDRVMELIEKASKPLSSKSTDSRTNPTR